MGAFTYTDDQVTIRLSTTDVDSLDLEYDQNFGADRALVYDGSLTLSSDGSREPRAFSLKVDFTEPYLYEPKDGNNLLIDGIFSGGDTGFIVDNHDLFNGKNLLIQGSVSNSAGGAWSIVPPLQFTVSQVPEPCSSLLCLTGVFGLSVLRRQRAQACTT